MKKNIIFQILFEECNNLEQGKIVEIMLLEKKELLKAKVLEKMPKLKLSINTKISH